MRPLRNRRWFRTSLLGFLVPASLALPFESASADPIHSHCDVQAFTIVPSGTIPPLPAAYTAGGLNAFQFVFAIPAPPPSNVPACFYETSDITDVMLNISFTGAMTWQGPNRIGQAIGPNRAFAGFVCGASPCMQTVHFDPHTTGVAFHVTAPRNPFPVTLFNDVGNFTITGIGGTMITGNHYYREQISAEPATAFALVAALALLARSSRRKRAVA